MAAEKRAQRGAFAAKMLVRALKVLGYSRNEIASTGIDTAALDQPGDEGALMAERNEIGNAEPPNRIARQIAERRWRRDPESEGKMTISARLIAHFTDFTAVRASRWLSAAAVLAAIATTGAADARAAAMIRPGAYDGTWNVVFSTQTGNCSATNSVPFAVSGRTVSSAGGGKVTGGISRGGVVAVNISVGLSHASGSGRLVGNSGTGRWSGIITGDKCSGSWQATRS
jgi:hypothetical protein